MPKKGSQTQKRATMTNVMIGKTIAAVLATCMFVVFEFISFSKIRTYWTSDTSCVPVGPTVTGWNYVNQCYSLQTLAYAAIRNGCDDDNTNNRNVDEYPKENVEEDESSSSSCIPSWASRAADILNAQRTLLQLDEVCYNATTDSGTESNACIVGIDGDGERGQSRAVMAPSWLLQRNNEFGLWLWPRLKIVLFACPKCGNTKVRKLLEAASKQIKEDVNTMTGPPMKGGWGKESNYSWQARFTEVPPRKRNNSTFLEQNLEAYQYVDELLANDTNWTTVGIIRHPYERLKSGFAELEIRWRNFGGDLNVGYKNETINILKSTSYWNLPADSSNRALAFWTEYVMGKFYNFDEDYDSNCLMPMPEAFHLSPIGAFFMRDSNSCQSSLAMYDVDHTIDVDDLHSDWPKFINSERFKGLWKDDNVTTNLASMAKDHFNTKALSVASALMTDLITNNDVFRRSVDEFYNHDFVTFGFDKYPSILQKMQGGGEESSDFKKLSGVKVFSRLVWAILTLLFCRLYLFPRKLRLNKKI